jgi:hypothetical protein
METESFKLAIGATFGGFCGILTVTTFSGFICVNPKCPEYTCEKHEHTPEHYVNSDNLRFQSVTLSGTAASGATGAYGPINFTNLGGDGDG